MGAKPGPALASSPARPHRLRRADQGRHRRRARRAAGRRRRSPARASGSAGTTRPFVIPEDVGDWPGARVGARGADACRAWEHGSKPPTPATARSLCAAERGQAARRCLATTLAAICARILARRRRRSRRARPRARARCAGAGHARADRRLGRSDTVEQHQGQGPERDHAAAISPAATSITACASMAWPRR